MGDECFKLKQSSFNVNKFRGVSRKGSWVLSLLTFTNPSVFPFCRFRLLFSYFTIIDFAFNSFSLNLKLTASAEHSGCPLSVPML